MVAPFHLGYVVDASVLTKWFVEHNEPDRDRALRVWAYRLLFEFDILASLMVTCLLVYLST